MQQCPKCLWWSSPFDSHRCPTPLPDPQALRIAELQQRVEELETRISGVAQASLPTKLTGELACILEDCQPEQSPEVLAALIKDYQPTWDRIISALSSTDSKT